MKGHGIHIGSTEGKKSVLEALQVQGEYILAPCGGNGTCGKCRERLLHLRKQTGRVSQSRKLRTVCVWHAQPRR